MEDQLRIIPIHRSLVRPQLIMGCERFLFLMLCMVVTLLAGPGGIVTRNYPNVAIAAVIFLTGRAMLAHMAKLDPGMSDVFRRAVQYLAEYPAVTTVGCKQRQKARRW